MLIKLKRCSVSTYLQVSACILCGVSLLPSAAQAQATFAGGGEEETSSRQLQFGAPDYEASNQSVAIGGELESGPLASGGVSRLNQQVSTAVSIELPDGVTLIVGESDASFMNAGQTTAAQDAAPSDSSEVDSEQAAELAEDVDRAQTDASTGDTPSPQISKVIIHYPVAINNIPVSKFADLTAFVTNDGQVQTVRKRNLPTSLNTETPVISAEDALAAAKADAGEWSDDATVSGPELEVWVDEDGSGVLSYRVELTNNGNEPMARRYWISASEGAEILYWESMIHHQHFGEVHGTIWTGPGTPTGPTSDLPLEEMNVSRSTGGVATTNEIGQYSFTSGGTGIATMSGNLSGPGSVIDNIAGSELQRSRNGSGTVGANLSFNATGAEELAQTTAFYFTNKARELAKNILSPTELASLPTNVNRPGSCNAFWNGSSINFFVAGGNCPNMAYNSVVYHEFGHGLDHAKGGIINGGYSEGFGDAMSILGTRESCVGADFFGSNTCLRDAADLIMWPLLPNEGVHAQGRRYAGFTWELTQQLTALYGEDAGFDLANDLVMGAALANPSDIPDAVHLSFVVDDDDGDLSNGTPHFAQLAAAADSRNIPRPASPTTDRRGYAWANNPTAASYVPSTTYAYNSSGGDINISRQSVGTYVVNFEGLGGNGSAGGNVQVTGYGSSANDCKVYWWSSGGADFSARIRCFTPAGTLVDDRYTILVNW